MEPPPFGDGNKIVSTDGDEAHVTLQWSHRLSAMETRLLGELRALNPALQWSHRLSAMETLTAISPAASMNASLQWSHRLSAMETSSAAAPTSTATTCFNGATAFRRWKHGECHAVSALQKRLQWSHRLSAMETCPTTDSKESSTGASMEPPPFGDGNQPSIQAHAGPV